MESFDKFLVLRDCVFVWNKYFMILDFGMKHTSLELINLLFIYLLIIHFQIS